LANSFKIAGLGEALWDAFPEGETFGGAPANFACHCRSLGADAFMVSSLGCDARGQKARAFLNQHGVDTACLVEDPEHETGVVLVTLDADGKPDYEIKQHVAWDHIPWTDAMGQVAAQLNAVCFGSLAQRSDVSRATIARFLAATPTDCLRVFDVNLRQTYYDDAILQASLTMASALKLSDEELPVVAQLVGADGDDAEKVDVIMKAFDLRLVVLTLGSEGALMVTPDDSSFATPPAIDVVNTVGAGDALTAAAITGFLRGLPLDVINAKANQLASYVCTQDGAVPSLSDATFS
jgi:fructokinase